MSTSYTVDVNWSLSKPTPLVAFPCGSPSTRSVRCSAAARLAARFTAVVVLPTPPFWLAIAKMTGERAILRGSGASLGVRAWPLLTRAPASRRGGGSAPAGGELLGKRGPLLGLRSTPAYITHMSLDVGVTGRRQGLPLLLREALAAAPAVRGVDRILAESFWRARPPAARCSPAGAGRSAPVLPLHP